MLSPESDAIYSTPGIPSALKECLYNSRHHKVCWQPADNDSNNKGGGHSPWAILARQEDLILASSKLQAAPTRVSELLSSLRGFGGGVEDKVVLIPS